jgi:hypothetical protein
VGPLERRLRAVLNPIATGLTGWWLGVGRRQVPPQPMPGSAVPHDGPRMFKSVPSPGGWVVPAGQRPGWQWLPEYGALPNLRAMPWWVRAWYRTPFIDRYAYEWMWWHGGWHVLVAGAPPPAPPDSGVREPRRPRPLDRSGAAAQPEVVEVE